MDAKVQSSETVTNEAFWKALRKERLTTTEIQALVDAGVYRFVINGAVSEGRNAAGMPVYDCDEGGYAVSARSALSAERLDAAVCKALTGSFLTSEEMQDLVDAGVYGHRREGVVVPLEQKAVLPVYEWTWSIGSYVTRRAGPQANKGVREMSARTYDKGLLEEAMDEVLRSARNNTANLSWVRAENAVALAQKAGLDVDGSILKNGRYPALVELRALIKGALTGTALVRITM